MTLVSKNKLHDKETALELLRGATLKDFYKVVCKKFPNYSRSQKRKIAKEYMKEARK